MSLYWQKCEVCDGRGELEIGNRFQKLFKLKIKIEQCPICKGQGAVPSKPYPFNPWKKERK